MRFVAPLRRSFAGATLALLAAAALAAALACCQNALGITGEITLSTDACGLQARAGECRSCVATHCCNEATACAGDPACAAGESCALQCGSDYACRARCSLENPLDVLTSRAALDTCVAAHCNAPCGMECGVTWGFTEPDAAQECQDCLGRSCGATEVCTTDLGCQLVAHCVNNCFTPDCRTECLQGDAGALFLAQAVQVGLECLSQCQIGDLWGCVGKVAYPLAQPGPADITLTITDGPLGAPFRGALVKACPASTDCTEPSGTGTTDANGVVTLTLPTQKTTGFGFMGYFDITVSNLPPGPQNYLFFLSYTLSVQHAKLGISLYSPSELASLLNIPAYQAAAGRGNLLVVATDCLSLPAPNVKFSANGIDGKTLEIYQQGTYLNAQATATDRSGAAMFLNAPAVPITVVAKPIPLGGTVSSTANVFVRAGALSIVQAIPTQE